MVPQSNYDELKSENESIKSLNKSLETLNENLKNRLDVIDFKNREIE
jgi:peptidoglycan hydrolase CwlO-like protein